MSTWHDELLHILSGAGVGIPGVNMFASSQKTLPKGAGPYLSVITTGGSGPENTHNYTTVPAYQIPGAQIVVRADNSYPAAEAMARRAYNALFAISNEWIGSGVLSSTGTWYRKIRPTQEPFDLGLDAEGRARVAFNVLGDKKVSPL